MQAHLIQVIKRYSDGTETIHEFRANPNAAEIEQAVAEASMGEVTASVPIEAVGEVTASVKVKKSKK